MSGCFFKQVLPFVENTLHKDLFKYDILNNFKVKVKCKLPSCVQLFVTPWTIQSMEFSRAEYWIG